MVIDAVEAGKDVYVGKTHAHKIDERVSCDEAVRRTSAWCGGMQRAASICLGRQRVDGAGARCAASECLVAE